MLAGMCLAKGSVMATGKLHEKLLRNILHSSVDFFDTTPLGRIMNRFSKDVDSVDIKVPEMFKNWFLCLLNVFAAILVVSMGTPMVIAVLVPLSVLYYFFMVIFHINFCTLMIYIK